MIIFLTLTIGFIGLIYLIHWVKRLQDPPGPLGIPGIGIIPSQMISKARGTQKKRHLFFADLAKQYGGISSFELGVQKFITLHDYKIIREALVDNADTFAGRVNELPFYKYIWKGAGIANADGEKWREHRRFVLRALRNLGLGRGSLESKIEIEATYLDGLLQENVNEPIDPSLFIVKAVSNIISSVVFGLRWSYDDVKFMKYVKCFRKVLQGNALSLQFPVFYPFLAKPWIMSLLPGCRDFITNNNKLLAFIRDQYMEHCQNYSATDEPNDILEAYIKETRSRDMAGESHSFTEQQTIHICYDLFLAGTDTTTCSLCWALLMLALYPEVQRRVHDEIDTVVGQSRLPNFQDKSSMPYFHAVLDETARYCTVFPHAVEKKVMHDTVFHGFPISKSSIISVDIYNVHHDPQLWHEPNTFNPDRFLDDNGSYKSNEHLMPFSIGKRSCLGESIAQKEIFVFLACIIQRFSVALDPNSYKNLEDILMGSEGMIHAPGEHKLIFKYRV